MKSLRSIFKPLLLLALLPALAQVANAQVPVVDSSANVTGQVGSPFSYTITATNSPDVYGASGLPDWLSRSGADITGTPPVTGTFNFTVFASNIDGTSAPFDVELIVDDPAPVITSPLTATGVANQSLNYQITATNNPTTFSAIGLGAIGLSLDTGTGEISGTPTQVGSYDVLIQASNVSGSSPMETLTITIVSPSLIPTVSSTLDASGVAGAPFSYQILATNSPNAFGASGFEAIGGLTFDPITGTLSGTPLNTGDFPVQISATNSFGTGQAVLDITINDPIPVITSAATASADTGEDFIYQITADNNPTSFGAVGLDAIGGLSFDSATGEISGQPLNEGVFDVVISATNATGTASQNLTITVTATVITSSSMVNGMVGTALNYQIVATNDPTAFSAAGLAQIKGLSLGSDGLISGTPTVFGIFVIPVTATNADGESAAKNVTFVINQSDGSDPAPMITSKPTALGSPGAPFTYEIVALGNPTEYDVIGINAIPGLTFADSTISGTPTQPGTYVVELQATNDAGTGTLLLTINIDGGASAAPNIVIEQPDAGEVFNIGESISVQVSVTDNDGFINLVQLTEPVLASTPVTMNRIGGTDIYELVFTPDLAQRVTAQGAFNFTINAWDNTLTQATNVVSVSVPSPNAPVVTIVDPIAGDLFQVGDTIQILIEAESGNPAAGISTVQVFNGLTSLGIAQPTGNPNEFLLNYTAAQTDVGTLQINATVTDSVGVSSTAGENVPVTVQPPPTPQVEILSPLGTTSTGVGIPVDITGTASVSAGNITTVDLYVNGVLTQSSTSTSPVFSQTFTNAGINTIFLIANSSFGAVGYSQTIKVIAQTETPQTSNRSFITQTFNDLFFRAPTQDELTNGLIDLDGGMTRGAYVVKLLDNTIDENSIVEMMSIYRTVIGDWLDYDDWATEYSNFQSLGPVSYETSLAPIFMANNPQLTFPIVAVDIEQQALYDTPDGLNEARFFNVLYTNKYGSLPPLNTILYTHNVLATTFFEDTSGGHETVVEFANASEPAEPIQYGPSNLPLTDPLLLPSTVNTTEFGYELVTTAFNRRVQANQLIAGLLRRQPTDQEVVQAARKANLTSFAQELLDSPEYTARFAVSYSLDVTEGANGSVTVVPEQVDPTDPSQLRYVDGTVVELTAVPDAGYSFISWTGDVVSTENPLNVTITGDTAITAVFAAATSSLRVAKIMQDQGIDNEADAALNYDFDDDGFTNVEEFAFGTNPALKSSTPVFETKTANGKFTVDLVTMKEENLPEDLQIMFECNGTLKFDTWESIDESAITKAGVSQSGVAEGYERIRVTLDMESDCLFVRGRVSVNQ